MHSFIFFLLCVFVLTLSVSKSQACGLDEISLGVCPIEATSERLLRAYDGDRATAINDFVWTKHPKFRNLGPKRKIVLNVCIFQGPATTVWGNQAPIQAADFRNRDRAFDNAAQGIENAVKPWETVSSNQWVKSVSRVDFEFRNTDGSFRKCENSSSNHILIVLADRNFSALGFEVLDEATTKSNKPLATMSLRLNLFGRITPDKALHEFGHALGMLHEMHHNDWSACADAFLAEKYAKSVTIGNNTSLEEITKIVESNIKALPARYRTAALPSTNRFDRFSIMSYQIDERFFNKTMVNAKNCEMPKDAIELTNLDEAFFLGIYGTR